jgi:GNAT superfamily N-acetyltransferase
VIERLEIVRAAEADRATVLDLVERLLVELEGPGRHPEPREGSRTLQATQEFAGLDRRRVLAALEAAADRFVAFLAREGGKPVGVLTLTEHFAIYAGGRYGVIDELYVVPGRRSSGVGRRLVEAAAAFGREKGWRRIDVTAPPGAAWERSVRFYETRGFVFTGPKLRLDLPGV